MEPISLPSLWAAVRPCPAVAGEAEPATPKAEEGSPRSGAVAASFDAQILTWKGSPGGAPLPVHRGWGGAYDLPRPGTGREGGHRRVFTATFPATRPSPRLFCWGAKSGQSEPSGNLAGV